jgi:hypothetical protein
MRAFAIGIAVLHLVVLPSCRSNRAEPDKSAPTAASTPSAPSVAVVAATSSAAVDAPADVTAADVASADATPRPLEYERAIASADLEGRTLRELALMRNSIWARQGKKFDKKWLADYFTAQPWYSPKKSLETPSELAQKNLEAIGKYDGALTREELLARAKDVRARVEAGKGTPEDRLEIRLLSERLGEWSGGDVVAADDRNPLEDPSKLDRLIDPKSLADMSNRDLRLLRNAIYARRGRPFVSPSVRAYFATMSWYHPEPKYTDEWLTAVDRKNIVIVQSAENERGGAWNENDENLDAEMKKNLLMFGA